MATTVVLTKQQRSLAKASASVTTRRVREGDKTQVLTTLDLGSPTLTDDLTYVFRRNVAKARRENKRLTGAVDSAPTNG